MNNKFNQLNLGSITGFISAIEFDAVSILNGWITFNERDFDQTVSPFSTNGKGGI